MLTHHVTHEKQAGQIVVVILQRLCHGFAYSLVTGKHDDRFRLFLLEDLRDLLLIQKVCLVEHGFLSGDLLHPVNGLFGGIVQIVHDDGLIALVQELHTGMASDVSGAARNKNFFHDRLLLLHVFSVKNITKSV